MSRQFRDLSPSEVDELAELLVEDMAGWLFDHGIAGAVRAVDWIPAHRIRRVIWQAYGAAQETAQPMRPARGGEGAR